MTKKAGKFAAVYKKGSLGKGHPLGAGTDPKIVQPPSGWTQAETDYLTDAALKSDRVSYPHETKPYTKADQVSPPGTAHVTRKGKVVKKG